MAKKRTGRFVQFLPIRYTRSFSLKIPESKDKDNKTLLSNVSILNSNLL